MIRKIQWNNYKGLGELLLDFSKTDGSIYNTIVLAGENGTGKTTILDTLSAYLNKQSVLPFKHIEYYVDGHEYIISPDANPRNAEAGFHARIQKNADGIRFIHSGKQNSEDKIEQDKKDLRHYGFVYSKARSGFITDKVKSTTTQQVDQGKYEPDNQENFTRIKQLLIDIEEQDDSQWRKISKIRGLSDQRYTDFERTSKGYRFENAFNGFFDNIQYIGTDDEDPNEKKVVFKKHGHTISVDNLSTGEKQIVFRGAHLLRYMNSISGGIVLIDEPELSMHPKWQKKILQFYRGLFTINGQQNVQMIIATHSEYVIQAALDDPDNVLVIVLKDENGTITNKNITAPNTLPSITAAETNYMAFGIPSKDYHIELYGWLQTKYGKHKIEECDLYISQQTQYDPTKHEMIDNSYPGHQYMTLPTYIRNAIDHPDSGRTYTEEQLKTSIQLLIELCK